MLSLSPINFYDVQFWYKLFVIALIFEWFKLEWLVYANQGFVILL